MASLDYTSENVSPTGTNNDKLRDIADKIMQSGKYDNSTLNSDGKTEYKFNSDLPETSLHFVDGDEEELELSFEDNAGDSLPESTPDKAEEPAPLTEDDLDIPDAFSFAEEYTEPNIFDEIAPMVWKTYIPRFTEVTERTYKLRDTSDVNRVAENTAAPTVKVKRVEVGSSSSVDKMEQSDSSAVIVNVDGGEQDRADTLNIFKFGKGESVPKIVPTDEELEREEITRLTGHKWEEPSEDVLEPKEIEPAQEIPEPEVAEEPNTYIPSEEHTPSLICDDELPENERPEGWDYDPTKTDIKDKTEYNSYAVREKHKDKFLDRLLSGKLRLIVSAVLTLLALVFENLSLFGIDILELLSLSAYPAAILVLDGALITALFLISLPETMRAMRALSEGRVIPELSLSLSAVAMLAYTMVMALNMPSEYPLFAFVYGIMVFLAQLASYFFTLSHFEAFKCVSERGIKTVVDNRFTRTLERENMALDGLVDEYKSKIARDFKCTFVQDFNKRYNTSSENHSGNLIILALAFGVALVTGAVSFFVADGITSAFSAFTLVISLSLPAFSLLSHKLPLYYTQREVGVSGTALLGEASIMDLSGTDCLTFLDTEIFGVDDVTFKSVSLSDRSGDLRKAMRQMSSLFAAVGGPLEELFYSSLGKSFPAAEEVVIENDGVIGMVDGVKIMAGNGEFMKRHGITVAPERNTYVESTRVMYCAEDGALFAKFNIQYNFSEEFARALVEMKEYKISPLVYTRDPNINCELMKFLTGGNDIIRVMRKTAPMPEREKTYRRLSGGLVTPGDKAEVLSGITASKRYKALQSSIALTEITACSVGAVLAALLSVLNMSGDISVLLAGAWQIGLASFITIISKKSFKLPERKTKHKKSK